MNTHSYQLVSTATSTRKTTRTTPDHPEDPVTAVLSRIAGWLACAERGWYLFPVRPGDKRPAIAGWQHRASADPDRLLEFFRAHPGFNAGIACGPSGLLVIDAP